MRREGTCVISNRRGRTSIALALSLALAGAGAAVASKGGEAKAQIAFGIDMAKRGLWNEALFRFEQVKKDQPADPAVLNNLAVAYEAVGRFDDAEAAYKEALKAAPSNRDIKKNVARFREFLQSFRAKKAPETPASTPLAKSEKPPKPAKTGSGR